MWGFIKIRTDFFFKFYKDRWDYICDKIIYEQAVIHNERHVVYIFILWVLQLNASTHNTLLYNVICTMMILVNGFRFLAFAKAFHYTVPCQISRFISYAKI